MCKVTSKYIRERESRMEKTATAFGICDGVEGWKRRSKWERELERRVCISRNKKRNRFHRGADMHLRTPTFGTMSTFKQLNDFRNPLLQLCLAKATDIPSQSSPSNTYTSAIPIHSKYISSLWHVFRLVIPSLKRTEITGHECNRHDF